MKPFDFRSQEIASKWKIVNDAVMGGRSNSHVELNDSKHLVFSGHVSLENNGGFAMCQYHFEAMNIDNFSKFVIKIKGDGKDYQFRAKSNNSDAHSYIYPFQTTGEWQIIDIPFNIMAPFFRGRQLEMPNYAGKQLEMVAFLIGNKKDENFNLEIDSINLH